VSGEYMKTNIVGDILANGGDLVSYGSKSFKQLAKKVFNSPKKRIRKLSPDIIRVGDRVEIINPEIVIRIGYPMSFDDAKTKVKELYHNEIVEFLNKTIHAQTKPHIDLFAKVINYNNIGIYNKIVSALAYQHMSIKGFGGKEKKIYSEIRQELLGIISTVTFIKIRKTGIYFPSSGGYDSYSGEYNFEPGGLDKMKIHKILQLDYCIDIETKPNWYETWSLQIEACNVKKLSKEEDDKITQKRR
jgi:hypothetical protein